MKSQYKSEQIIDAIIVAIDQCLRRRDVGREGIEILEVAQGFTKHVSSLYSSFKQLNSLFMDWVAKSSRVMGEGGCSRRHVGGARTGVR